MTTTTGLKTPLYDEHVAAGARIVDFGGWDMPLHYGSQKEVAASCYKADACVLVLVWPFSG